MLRKKIVIDAATIYPGKGGAGGGIWSYARNLLLHIDEKALAENEIEFICLVNETFDLPLQSIKIKRLKSNFQNFIIRFLYIHIYLPFYVYRKKAVLHKLYFESPMYTPSKLLVTIHDNMGSFYKKKGYATSSALQQLKAFYFNWINAIAVKRSHYICTPSTFVKNELVENYGIPAQKVFVTPLATTTGHFDRIDKKDKSAIHIYCIAAFHRHKGQLRLIDIFETLMQSYNIDAQLFFRGHVHDKTYYEAVKERIATSPVQKSMHIVSYKAQSSLQDIYKDADWVMLLSEYEGFGLPVIEAQAHHTPIICSDIPTFKEVAGHSAFYIEETLDVRTAAKKLYTLFTDEASKRELVEKGLVNAKQYTWDRFASQMIEIYKMLAFSHSHT